MVNEMTRGRSLSAVKRSGRLMLLLVVFWGDFCNIPKPPEISYKPTDRKYISSTASVAKER
jgi:hypothetical protein